MRLDNKIRKKGIVEVLRKGLSFQNKTIMLYAKSPSSAYNKKDAALFAANIFSVTQKLKYTKGNENRIDLVVAVNGLPVMTMELFSLLTRG